MQKKYGKVNYRIQRVGVKSAGKVTHINNLMKYVERRVVNRLDVVTEEEPGTEYLEGENGKEVLI